MIKRLLNFMLIAFSKRTFKSFGIGTKINLVSSYVVNKKIVSLGKYVFIGPEAYISANLEIKDYVMIGPRLTLIGGNHSFGVLGKHNRFLQPKIKDTGHILIEEDAWIGANVTILPNVVIGMGAVIGAGSLVNKTIPPFCVAAGNPAKIKKIIFSDDDLEQHLKKLSHSNSAIKTIIQKRRVYCEKNNIPC